MEASIVEFPNSSLVKLPLACGGLTLQLNIREPNRSKNTRPLAGLRRPLIAFFWILLLAKCLIAPELRI